jgi:transcriptional regulator with XRE-family HTH domain
MKEQETKAAGDTLREARKRAGLTIAELAYKAKVSPATISAHENHGIPPAPMARWRIAAVLGISSLELFPGTDPLPWERHERR